MTGRRKREIEQRIAGWRAPVQLRLADDADGAAISAVAKRDSSYMPSGPHLVAEREGAVVAALSLSSGEVVADPFRRTAEVVELLRCHAGGLQLRAVDRERMLRQKPIRRSLAPRLTGGAA